MQKFVVRIEVTRTYLVPCQADSKIEAKEFASNYGMIDANISADQIDDIEAMPIDKQGNWRSDVAVYGRKETKHE